MDTGMVLAAHKLTVCFARRGYSETGGAELLRFDEVRGFLDAGRHISADVRNGDAVHAGDKAELADIDAQSGIFDLMLKQRAGKVSRGETVRLGDFTDIINRRQSAAATHVLNRDRRASGNMPRQVFSEDARFDIGRTAGGEVDDEVDSLALIERSFFRREGNG